MPLDIVILVGTTAASALGAFVAAVLGVRLATDRQRRARAAEKQAEWYEQVLRSMGAWAMALNARQQSDAAQRAWGVEPNPIEGQVRRAMTLQALLDLETVYATDATRSVLNDTFSLVTRILTAGDHSRAAAGGADVGSSQALEMAAGLVGRAEEEIRREFRCISGLAKKHKSEWPSQLAEGKRMFDELRDAEGDRWTHYDEDSELVVEMSDDRGGSWQEVYEGPQITIRVRELVDAEAPWRVVHDPHPLLSREVLDEALMPDPGESER